MNLAHSAMQGSSDVYKWMQPPSPWFIGINGIVNFDFLSFGLWRCPQRHVSLLTIFS
ncbi:hypothetical protein BDV37DRAFT_249180 [Aspergillus pseudonomiae]|uniref:Uncharacterized protein n=1 Tax=Aspergillus pseudonomiae TaxID=1506151 RepID=A0A5N7DCL8_9EURO|nr:uncharacterized protein BDV37DRAFT_249180 [Aspergillus pseudonomiae]KAE8403743.1 hypothetical protein BDV37DRAFT_249180 [Aspergillus pseudonomiae]